MSSTGASTVAWQLSPDDESTMTEHWRHLPIPMNATLAAPKGYRAPQAAVDAVNVALALASRCL